METFILDTSLKMSFSIEMNWHRPCHLLAQNGWAECEKKKEKINWGGLLSYLVSGEKKRGREEREKRERERRHVVAAAG